MLDTHESINKDDNDWMTILSGRSIPDADPNTIREARVLRMVLLAPQEEETEKEFAKTDDQQWQRLENKLIKEGHIRPESLVKKRLKFLLSTIVNTSNQMTELLTWQKLSLATAYTVLVSVVTLTLFLPTKPVEMQPKSAEPNDGQNRQLPRLVRYLPMPNLQQDVLDLQKKFTDRGTDKKDVVVFEMVSKNESDPQQLIVAIPIAENPSMDLYNLYETYEIDPKYNRWVYFVCEAHAEVKPE